MVDPELDEQLDRNISESLSGEAESGNGGRDYEFAGYQHLRSEIARVLTEDSPRLTSAAQARHQAQLRALSNSKRGAAKSPLTWLLHAAPRWAQVAAIAIIVVIIANGITVASASSLPGSPLYPFKRLAEQSNVLLAPTSGERARIWMDLASLRLDEVQSLLAIQPRVDQKALDDIDESILHALTEITGTRGTERIALLQQIIQLTVREQTVLDELAQNASSDDRARFEQTSRLLRDVANIAGSAQSNLGAPNLTPTETTTATASPSSTVTPAKAMTPTLEPTDTPVPPSPIPPTTSPSPQANPPGAPSAHPQGPGLSPTPQKGSGPSGQASETPERNWTVTPEWQKSETPWPHKSETPEGQRTQTPQGRRTGTPEGGNNGPSHLQEANNQHPQDTSAPNHQSADFSWSRGARVSQLSHTGNPPPRRANARQSKTAEMLLPQKTGTPQPPRTVTHNGIIRQLSPKVADFNRLQMQKMRTGPTRRR